MRATALLRLFHAGFVAILLALTVLGGAAVTPALAQTEVAEELDYEAWSQVATRAEEAIASGRPSSEAYASLREELVAWRERFLAAQGTNAARIETVRNQIAALGPPPEEGESEGEEVAQRREELNQLLAELTAPVRRAEEAHERAEGLIREIDVILRERQTDALLERDPAPINPANWPAAWSQLRASIAGMLTEIETNWNSPARRVVLRDDLPFLIGLAIVALVLLARGRLWMERLTAQVFERFGSRLAGLLVSLGQVVVPTAGIFLLVFAVQGSGLTGIRSETLLLSLPVVAFFFFFARWIAGRVAPKRGTTLLAGEMSDSDARSIRIYAAGLGIVSGLHVLVFALAPADGFTEAARAVVYLPLSIAFGILLYRLGRVLRRHLKAQLGAQETSTFQVSVQSAVARVAMAVAVLGPLLALAGYTTASQLLLAPTVGTLAFFAGLLILVRLVADLYMLLTGASEDTARHALVPTLINFVLIVALLPLLALIWGARWTDLTELWTRFQAGFAIGDTRIAPSDFLFFVIVFLIGYMATRVVQNGLKTAVLPKTKLDTGGRNAIVSGVGYVGIFLAAIIAITSAGIDLSALAVVAGALSVGIGFGLQNVVQNFVAGIILLVERPIGEGDWIEVGGNMGIVKSISVRSTTIETFDKTKVIVPNADFISGTVTNWTRGSTLGRVIVSVGVAYGTDTRKVAQILKEIAEAQPLVVLEPPPMIMFAGFGADSLDFEIRMILSDVNYSLSVKDEVHHQIAQRFAEEGIEIPFAQRDVWLRNPETLVSGGAAPPAAGEAGPAAGEADAEANARRARAQITEADMGVENGAGEGEGR